MITGWIDYIKPLYRKLILVLLDSIAISVSFYLAVSIQFPARAFQEFPDFFLKGLCALIVIRIAVFFWFGLYDLIWRYASIFEVGRIFKAVTVGTMAVMALQFLFKTHRIPGRVLIVEVLVCLLAIGTIRFSLRLYRDYLRSFTDRSLNQKKESVLIIGAGDGGEVIAREIKKNPTSPYTAIGFIDDSASKQGKQLHQIPVLGTITDIKTIAAEYRIKTAIIAIPSASGKLIRHIVNQCDAAGIKSKITPNLSDLLAGKVQISQVRNVAIDDLLGRDVIDTDLGSITAYITGATVLVTGAGGSIGSELARQLVDFSPKKIILLDHAETALYHIDMELRHRAPTATIHSIVADVKDVTRITQLFNRFSPTIVFHAAAYKHVPLMEFNPEEAILNNVFGTQTLLDISGAHKVNEFVLISTDKAVRPTNAMGASKRLCEIILQRANQKFPHTKFTAVRFGNVLGSQGSVIPLFTQQIQNGGPITVTHPDVTRYFMTIPEAIRLIIQAGAMAKGGDLFILDMGDPVKVLNLAKDLIHLSGYSENDIKIEFTGLRPGEKLYEELVFDPNELLKTHHKKIFVTQAHCANLVELETQIQTLITNCYTLPSAEIREQLIDIANNSDTTVSPSEQRPL